VNHISSIALRRRVVGSVEFVCPRCGLDRGGLEVTVRRWWCLAHVPLVPLGDGGPAVVCGTCGHHCDVGVIEIPTTVQLAVLLERAPVAAVSLLVGVSSDLDSARVLDRSVSMLAAEGYDYDAVRLTAIVGDGTRETDRDDICRLRHELTQCGKYGFLHRVTGLATTEDALTPAHRDALIHIGRMLGLTIAEVRGLLAIDGERADV